MPRPFMKGHILDGFSISLDEQVGRNAKVLDAFEVRMRIWVQAICKKLVNIIVAEFCRRKADAMDNDKGYVAVMGSFIKIWRWMR